MPASDYYEQYLDSLDERFYIRGSTVHVEFSKPFLIDLHECSSLDAVIQQTRLFTIKLIDEPGLDVQYLVGRFIHLAADFHKWSIDTKAIANAIGLVHISDVVWRRCESQLSKSTALRFENGKGAYAGSQFLQLERVPIHENELLEIPLRVTRNMTGMGDRKCEQHAIVSQLGIVETEKHLLLFLPESTSWQYGCQTSETMWHWYHGTRFALQHSFDEPMLSTIQADFRNLMQGLRLQYTPKN